MRPHHVRLALCLLLASACGGENPAITDSRAALAAGDVSRAEAALSADSSFEADELRREIARVKDERRTTDVKVRDLVANAQSDPVEARLRLEDLRKSVRDATARAQVERTLNELDGILAQKAADARARAEREAHVEYSASSQPAPLATQVRSSIALKEWVAALDALAKLESEQGDSKEVAALRKQIQNGARDDAEALAAQARKFEDEDGLTRSVEYLDRESVRFPDVPDYAIVHRLHQDMRQRKAARDQRNEGIEPTNVPERVASTPAQPRDPQRSAPKPPTAAAPAGASADDLVAMARKAAEQGDLALAQQHWMAASTLVEPGNLRDDYVGEAQDLRARLALRSEIRDSFKLAPSLLGDLGITAVDERGWTERDKQYAWGAIALDQLQRVATKLDVSKLARRGVVCEVLRSADAAARERCIVEVAHMVERGEIQPADAANLVSRARGGIGTSERYLLVKGQWVTPRELEAEAKRAQLAQLEKALLRANSEQRDAALHDLIAANDDKFLAHVLAERAQESVKQLEHVKVLDQLGEMSKTRRELDDARKAALALIFDEKVYFYPYNPPEPPNTEGDYARAQRRVDELVNAVRAVWKNDRAVRVTKEFRAAVDDFQWCAAKCGELNIAFELDGKVPAYALCIAPELESVTLREFAWDRGEAANLATWRKTEAHNEATWKEIDAKKLALEPAAIPDVAEREQVRITNEYRVMFGRCALAWNAKLELAAQGHSDYMANTGDFNHFEKDPARKTPFDRMKLAGYPRGDGENLAMNGGDPKSAHDGWCHSSGHHRNILDAGHRDMASALTSNYWTQNFGVGMPASGEVEK